MVKRFGEINKNCGKLIKDGYEKVSLRDLVGQEITIVDVEFKRTNYGDGVVLYTSDGKAILSNSNVIIEQAQIIKEALDGGEDGIVTKVRFARSSRGFMYYTFE